MGASWSAPEGESASHGGRLAHRVYLFTDIVDSTAYKRRHGEQRSRAAILAHDDLFRESLARAGGSLNKDTGDGFLAIFEDAVSAVHLALDFQSGLARLAREFDFPEPIRVRISLHQGHAWFHPDPLHVSGEKLIGLAVDQSARLLRLTGAGQIRMTREVFDLARAGWDGSPAHWFTLGERPLGAGEEIIELCGVAGPEEATPTQDSPDGQQESSDVIPGWRPAAGRAIPGRAEYILTRLLGAGAFGEVWEAAGPEEAASAFKFCFSAIGLRGLRREVSLFGMIKGKLRPDDPVVPVLDSRLDGAPYYVEMPVAGGGNLADWIRARPDMTLRERMNLAAQIAEALEITHALGVIHADVKPLNILMLANGEGFRPALSDFGLGKARQTLIQRQGANQASIAVTALTGRDLLGGTRAYMAPEIQTGGPSTIQSDIYALGVVLYQLFIGDFTQPIAEGWQRGLSDPLLCEDIARAIDLDPARRFGSAEELAGSLRAYDARKRRYDRLSRRERTRRRMTHPATLITIGLVGATALGFLITQMKRQSETQIREMRQTEARNQEEARSLRKAAEYEQYASTIALAADLLRGHRPLQAREALFSAPVEPRDWDWSALLALSVPETLILYDGQAKVRRANFTPDGGLVVSVGGDGMARVWNATDGRLMRRIEASGQPLLDFSLLPEGRGFVVTGESGEVSAWSFNAENLFRIAAHDKPVNRVLVHPSRPLILTASDDSTVGVWSISDGSPIARLTGHSNWVNDIDLDPTGRWLASASDDGTGRLWDLDNPGGFVEFRGHAGPVNHVACSPDGRHVATTSDDKTVKIWSADDGSLTQTLLYHQTPTRFARWVDFESLITTANGHDVVVWRIGTPEPIATYAENGLDPRSLEHMSEHQLVAAGGTDGYIRIFNLVRDDIQRIQAHQGDISSLRMSPRGDRILSSGSDGLIKIYALVDGRIRPRIGGEWLGLAYISGAAMGPPGLSLVGDDTGTIWALNDLGKPLTKGKPHGSAIRSIIWLPSTREFAVGYLDGVALKVNERMEVTARLLSEGPAITSMLALPDGLVAIGNEAGTIITVDHQEGRILNRSGLRNNFEILRIGTTGPGSVFAVFRDGNVMRKSGQTLSEFFLRTGYDPPESAHFTALTVSADGELIAGVLTDMTGGVWRSRDGSAVCRFKLNLGEPTEKLEFLPSNKRLVLFPNDHFPIIFDPQTGRELFTFENAVSRKRGFWVTRANDDRTLIAQENALVHMLTTIPAELFRHATTPEENLGALAETLSARANATAAELIPIPASELAPQPGN